jgi:hypothetical protein
LRSSSRFAQTEEFCARYDGSAFDPLALPPVSGPDGVCSDGVSFKSHSLARF